jgi:uncharacterized protein involved in response to NO
MSSEAIRTAAPPERKARSAPMPLFSLGFRPFYLLAAATAFLLVPCWVLVYLGFLPVHAAFGGVDWHAHEMIFGYTVAVLVGFLYTAVPNWTGIPTPRGAALAGLAALWLLGRIAMLAGGALPAVLVGAIDVAFLPLAALGVLVPLWRKRNWRNIGFPIGMLVLAALNLAMHLEAAGTIATGGSPVQLALAIFTLVLVVMTARVVPFFTGNALPHAGARRLELLDRASLVFVVLSLAASWLRPEGPAAGLLALTAGALLLARMVPWRPIAAFANPMLWVLHLGHLWLALAFVLRGAMALGVDMIPSIPDHALTVGAIGGLTLGMMARSGLGHSGRRIAAGPWLATAFVAINVAAWARSIAPLLVPSHLPYALGISSVAWMVAFGAFLVVLAPVCVRPRADALRAG